MILLWGLPADEPLAVVFASLRESQREVAFVDQRDVLSTEVELSSGATTSGTVWVRGDPIDLSQVGAVYLRPYETRRLPPVSQALSREGACSSAYTYAMAVEETLITWCEVTNALVVNRPSAMASNGSKPYQAVLIAAEGFRIPDTLITTDPEAALEFWHYHGEIIYKSVSSVRSIVTKMTPQQQDRLGDLQWCPTQFQEFIEGEDYRVHVVGNEIFACRIDSAATDYRYARSQGADVQITSVVLPEDVANASRRLARSLRLPVAGVDLRRTPEGEWYCFEVNPSPGFTFYENSTQRPIARAIAQLLVSGESGKHAKQRNGTTRNRFAKSWATLGQV
jgi:glutathione synthase/RimK-type ligase-like ATP-grasp enzyme